MRMQPKKPNPTMSQKSDFTVVQVSLFFVFVLIKFEVLYIIVQLIHCLIVIALFLSLVGVQLNLSENYIYSTENECGKAKKQGSLDLALQLCEFSICEGILDAHCDGKDIYTCGKISRANDPSSPSNGCTYIKKGYIIKYI